MRVAGNSTKPNPPELEEDSRCLGIYSHVELTRDPNGSMTYRPHFQVVVKGKVWCVKAGRLNVFNTLALFLYSLKANGITTEAVEEVLNPRKRSRMAQKDSFLGFEKN